MKYSYELTADRLGMKPRESAFFLQFYVNHLGENTNSKNSRRKKAQK